MIKLLIFDLDGTLVNSIEDLADASNYALTKHGFPSHEKEKYNYFVGDGVMLLLKRALPENNRDDHTIDLIKADFSEYYNRNYSTKTKPYEGLSELLSALKAKGLRMAVASNKPDEFSKIIVEHFFEGLFEMVQGNKPDVPKKPDPQIVFEILEKLNVDKSECLFVGDTNVDIRTGKSAGVKSVGCLWGFRDLEELQEAEADYIISKPSEILNFI